MLAEKMINPTMTVPRTRFSQFRRQDLSLRWGQEFYNYMDWYKVKSGDNADYANQIYYEKSTEKARAMVLFLIDEAN